MKLLKTILSIMALLTNALAIVLASGAPVQVPPQWLFLVQSAFGAIGILGISPIDLPDPIKRLCSALAAIGVGILGVHAGSVSPGVNNAHPYAWAAFGLVVAAVGVMGKSLLPHGATSPAPVPAPAPPPVEPR